YKLTAYGIEQDESVFDTDASAICYAQPEGQLMERDAELIAHAPSDMQALIAEVERLRSACEQTIAACEACDEGVIAYSPPGLDAWILTGEPNIITESCPFCGPARDVLNGET